MAISAGRNSPLPGFQHHSITDSHCLRQGGIKVSSNFSGQIRKFVTDLTIRRIWCDSRVRVVTSKAARVTDRDRLERAFLQPECVTEPLRRLGHILFARLALRLICLMTNPTVCGRFLLLFLFPRNRNKSCGRISSETRSIATNYFEMCFMWKVHCKLAGAVSARTGSPGHVAQTRKEKAHGIARRYRDVAIRANLWRRSLTCEELLAMAIKTRRVLRELSDIRKSRVAFTNLFPVGSGKLVARITGQLLFGDVSSMRKVRVVSARLRARARLYTPLRCSRNGRQNKANSEVCR